MKVDAAGRRTRLRQYQVQLLERMQAARTNTGARIHQLGVLIGGERILLDLTQAGEIVPVAPLSVVPLTQDWYLGLANIRGNLVGIVDLARFVGLGETLAGPDSRLVTFNAALGFNCALLVSRVFGLRHAGDMQQVGGMDQAGDMEQAGGRLVDADANEWTVLDLTALVRDPRFLQIGL